MGRLRVAAFLPEGEDVRCIACNRPLDFLPGAYPLTFRCEAGHFLTLSDLLNDALGDPSAHALEQWPRRARLLRRLAARALERGHALPAADLQEAALRIDRWILNLKTLFARNRSR